MAEQLIISIGREYGSAGHKIAEKVAKELNLEFYDRKRLDELAEEKDEEFEQIEEKEDAPRNPFLMLKAKKDSKDEDTLQKQFNYLQEKADSGESFVVVGRCAEVVLTHNDANISIFILGDIDTKMKHVMRKYGIDEKEALAKMKRHDRNRKKYHNEHAQIAWGDSRGYDLTINSSKLGTDKTVEAIVQYVKLVRGI